MREEYEKVYSEIFPFWKKITEEDKNYICDNCGYVYYSEDLQFALNEDGKSYCVTGFSGTESEVIIPSYYNHLPVTVIASNAFVRFIPFSSTKK